MSVSPIWIEYGGGSIPIATTLQGKSQVRSIRVPQVEGQKELDRATVKLRYGHSITSLRQSETVLHAALESVSRRQWDNNIRSVCVAGAEIRLARLTEAVRWLALHGDNA